MIRNDVVTNLGMDRQRDAAERDRHVACVAHARGEDEQAALIAVRVQRIERRAQEICGLKRNSRARAIACFREDAGRGCDTRERAARLVAILVASRERGYAGLRAGRHDEVDLRGRDIEQLRRATVDGKRHIRVCARE